MCRSLHRRPARRRERGRRSRRSGARPTTRRARSAVETTNPRRRAVAKRGSAEGCGDTGGGCCRHRFTGVGDIRFRALAQAVNGSGRRHASRGQHLQARPVAHSASTPGGCRSAPLRRALPGRCDPGSTAVLPGLARLFSVVSNALARCEPLLATRLVALARSTQTGHVRLHCARSSISRKSSQVGARQSSPARIDRPADGSSRTIIARALGA